MDRSPQKFTIALLLAGLLASQAAAAQTLGQAPTTWQEGLDVQTAAAAAATVLHARCSSAERQKDAQLEVARRFSGIYAALEQSGVPAQSAQAYAQESYRLKVLAMWQSSQGLACSASALPRLKDLATWGQYSLPSSVR